MTAIKARSVSDLKLVRWIESQTGVQISPWQVERWRQAGLLQTAEHEYPGTGSYATYSAEARRQVLELARLSREYHRHDVLARVLFYRGFWVRDDALRRSYDAVFAHADEWIGPSNTEAELDALDRKAQDLAAQSGRTKFGRRLRHRLRGYGGPVDDTAAAAMYTMLHLLKTGVPTTPEGLGALLQGMGVTGFFEDRIGDAGPLAPGGPDEFVPFFRESSLGGIRRAIAEASAEDLIEARDLLKTLVPFFRSVAVLVTRMLGVSTALGLTPLLEIEYTERTMADWVPVGLLMLPQLRTDGPREFVGHIREHAAYFEQMAAFAESIPEGILEALRAHGETALGQLPVEERERIRSAAGAVQIAGRGLPWADATTNDVTRDPA